MLKDKSLLKLFLSEEKILEKVRQLAAQIDRDYNGKEIILVMILKGSICFVADLIRHIQIPLQLEAIRCQSYGVHGTQRGHLSIQGEKELILKDKDVLLVDDIFDSGLTLEAAYLELLKKHPKSLKTAVLLSKKVAHQTSFRPDYSLFTIENQFVVGYGLDYKEYYRGLKGLYIFTEEY